MARIRAYFYGDKDQTLRRENLLIIELEDGRRLTNRDFKTFIEYMTDLEQFTQDHKVVMYIFSDDDAIHRVTYRSYEANWAPSEIHADVMIDGRPYRHMVIAC